MNVARATAILGSALALVLATPAQAHVTIQPSEVPAGEFVRIDIQVPNERDDATTKKLDVQLPFGLFFVSTEPVPGWKTRVTTKKLPQPRKLAGEAVTERAVRFTATAESRSDRIQPGEFREFPLSGHVPKPAGRALPFKSLQTYDNGDVVRWIGPPNSENPTPRLKLVAAAAAGPQAKGEEDDDDSETLSYVAIGVGAAGLLAALIAIAIARRRA